MNSRLKQEFVSSENRKYTFKLGTLVASSLSGFIAGVLLTAIVWLLWILTQRGV